MFFYSSHELHNHHLDFKLKMFSKMFRHLGKRQLGHFMPIFTDRTKDQIAWILVFFCPAFFSSNMIIARGMAGYFPPLSMAFIRWFFVGVVIISCLALLRRFRWTVMSKEIPQILFLASLGMGICGGPVYIAAEITTATNIGLIYSAAPLLIALISYFAFKALLNKYQSLGLFMGLFGVLVIVFKADLGNVYSLVFNTGDLIIVATTISFAIYSIGLKYLKSELTQIERFGAMALGGALWHFPFLVWEVVTYEPWPMITWAIIGAFSILVFIASIGAYLSYGMIVTRLGTTVAGSTLYLAPIYAAVLAVIILDEQIMFYHLIGGGFILPGLWLISRQDKSL